jgi:hypothetical protein
LLCVDGTGDERPEDRSEQREQASDAKEHRPTSTSYFVVVVKRIGSVLA